MNEGFVPLPCVSLVVPDGRPSVVNELFCRDVRVI